MYTIRTFRWSWVLMFVFFGSKTGAQSFEGYTQLFGTPRHYVCYHTSDSLVIDGNASETVWQKAPWTEDFLDIEGAVRPRPTLRTRARMLWDARNLYIYAELEEPELQGVLRQHDTIIYQDNDFEIFLNPDNNTHNYFEIEINSLGTVMDLFMFKPYRDGGKALMSWDTQGLRSAVKRKGTLNHPADKDGGWSVEMAIPLSTLRFFGERPPRDSSLWRINFSRVEWDWDVKDGQYVKRVDPVTGKRLPEHNWVWSPQGIIDMHAPERWGYLQFSTQPVGGDAVGFVAPVDERARDYCWLIYYKQRDYRRVHGRYATSLQDLGFADSKVEDQGRAYTLLLEAFSTQYTASVRSDAFIGALSIDQDGKIERRQ